MQAESGGVVLKEEEKEVMEKGRIGALLDAGHNDVLVKNNNYTILELCRAHTLHAHCVIYRFTVGAWLQFCELERNYAA